MLPSGSVLFLAASVAIAATIYFPIHAFRLSLSAYGDGDSFNAMIFLSAAIGGGYALYRHLFRGLILNYASQRLKSRLRHTEDFIEVRKKFLDRTAIRVQSCIPIEEGRTLVVVISGSMAKVSKSALDKPLDLPRETLQAIASDYHRIFGSRYGRFARAAMGHTGFPCDTKKLSSHEIIGLHSHNQDASLSKQPRLSQQEPSS
jgi:hypothetical protein